MSLIIQEILETKYRLIGHIKKILTCDISKFAKIPKSTKFPHPIGIVIGNYTEIGKNCTILHGVTITHHNDKLTHIGNNVYIGANAFIRGVNIGNNCIIGANSIILKDIPENTVAVGLWK